MKMRIKVILPLSIIEKSNPPIFWRVDFLQEDICFNRTVYDKGVFILLRMPFNSETEAKKFAPVATDAANKGKQFRTNLTVRK